MSNGAWVYCLHEVGCESDGPCKVGVATNFGKRLAALQGGNHRRLVVAWRFLMHDRYTAIQVESHTLSRLRPDVYAIKPEARLCSEWVRCGPHKVLEVAGSIAATFDDFETLKGDGFI